MRLTAILTELYESELNCSISSIWDSGWTVKLGDKLNGFVEEGNFRTIEEVAGFLHSAAMKHFPESGYANRSRPGVAQAS